MGIIDYIKNSAEKVDNAAKRNAKASDEFGTFIQELKNTTLKYRLDQKSLDQFKAIGDKNLADQKTLYESTDRNMRRLLCSFKDEFTRNLDAKGFWCSERAFRWLMPVFIISIGFNILVMVLWIASHLG